MLYNDSKTGIFVKKFFFQKIPRRLRKFNLKTSFNKTLVFIEKRKMINFLCDKTFVIFTATHEEIPELNDLNNQLKSLVYLYLVLSNIYFKHYLIF